MARASHRGSSDLTIKLWDTNSGTEILTLTGHAHVITCVAFSPDGRLLASASADHSIKLWVDREFRNTPHEKACRAAKVRFDPVWYQEQAEQAAAAKDWYAATFHFALLVKNDPDQASFYDGLQSSFQKLESEFEQKELDLEPRLAMVVRESSWVSTPQRITPAPTR